MKQHTEDGFDLVKWKQETRTENLNEEIEVY